MKLVRGNGTITLLTESLREYRVLYRSTNLEDKYPGTRSFKDLKTIRAFCTLKVSAQVFPI